MNSIFFATSVVDFLETLLYISLHHVSRCKYKREKNWCDLINIGPIEFSAHLHTLTEIYFLANIVSCRSDFNLNGDERTIFQQACLINVYAMCRT